MESPWPLDLVKKFNRQRDQKTEYARILSSTQGGRGRYTGDTEGPMAGEPSRGRQGTGLSPSSAEEEATSHGKWQQTQAYGAGNR